MIAIEITFTIINCIGDYYLDIDSSKSYPTSVYVLAIMVRDVRDHTFSSLDGLWSLRKGFILPQAPGQYELMIQRNVLHTNALG